MEELRTYHSRAKRLERELDEARLQYAACSSEYQRAIADLTACRENGLAAARERDALKATLEQAWEACHVEHKDDGLWLVLKNAAGSAAINLLLPFSRGRIVRMVIEAAARDVGTKPVDLQASLEP